MNTAPGLPISMTKTFENMVESYGEGVDTQNLLRQVLLHVYRFHPDEIEQHGLIAREVKRLKEKLVRLNLDTPKLSEPPDPAHIELPHTRLDFVDSSTAEIVHRAHHYLGSFRGDAVHLGLYHQEVDSHASYLMSVVSLSPFDLMHIADALPYGLRPEQVMVLSRLFAFHWSPHNTISHTLGRVFCWLRERLPHIKMLITYLDPNLGFSGSVYKATNWVLFGRERKKRYLYLDSDYITDRQLIRIYGTADFHELRTRLGDRLSCSLSSLEPLEIFVYFLDDALRRKGGNGFNHEFQPESRLVGE